MLRLLGKYAKGFLGFVGVEGKAGELFFHRTSDKVADLFASSDADFLEQVSVFSCHSYAYGYILHS